MGRGKIEVKRIENKISRQVTFSKRRQGVLKKTNELAILCDAQIALIIFSATAKLHVYHSPHSSLEQIIQRYLNVRGIQLPVHDHNQEEEMYQEVQALRAELNNAEQKMKHYLGHDLGPGPGPGLRLDPDPLLLEDLHKHEQQLESSLSLIRARKNQLMHQQLDNLRRKEQMLQHDNGNMYHWLMGAGQVLEQQQQQVPEQLPLYGEDEPTSSTVLQLATTSSSSQFYPFHLHPTQPDLHDYGQ